MQYWPRHLVEEYLQSESMKDNIQTTQSIELKRLLEQTKPLIVQNSVIII